MIDYKNDGVRCVKKVAKYFSYIEYLFIESDKGDMNIIAKK
jgi:hypothetical protein